MSFKWSPDLAIGVGAIDRQHQELFKAADDLAQAMSSGKGMDETSPFLEFLETYVVNHFQAEEVLMMKHSYPGYQAHKREHAAFILDFVKLRQEFRAHGPTAAVIVGLNSRVSSWLRTHIRQTDTALGKFLTAKGISVNL